MKIFSTSTPVQLRSFPFSLLSIMLFLLFLGSCTKDQLTESTTTAKLDVPEGVSIEDGRWKFATAAHFTKFQQEFHTYTEEQLDEWERNLGFT